MDRKDKSLYGRRALMVITRKIADYVVSTQLEDFPPDAVHAA